MDVKPPQLLFRIRDLVSNDQFVLGVLAVVVGLVVGLAVVAFRLLIDLFHLLFYGGTEQQLATVAAGLPWWHLVLAPTIGGLAVGLWYRYAMPGRRPQGIANIIEATATRGSRLSMRAGIAALFGSALSIGVGAPVGREGPAVHFGATLAAYVAEKLHFGRALSRTLLGCGAAAAVAASFNAPIAGALFAHEVVVGHYAMSAFAPVVVASVTATLISRWVFGDFPAFTLPEMALTSVLEFPAFAGLGIVAGVAALVFMRGVFTGEEMAARSRIPPVLRPVAAGLVIGLLAIPFPLILGVGYEATDRALNDAIPPLMLMGLLVAKTAGTGLALGFGFGGGVFSPSLTVGALVGVAYGGLATAALPELSSGPGAYALVGMGAVAAAVLGAPISTVLIVFEMTHDTALTVAVMVAVVVATTITQHLARMPSFFHWQLERKGLNLKGGRDVGLLRLIRVGDVVQTQAPTLSVGAPLREVREKLAAVPFGEVFVVAADGTLFGTITLADLQDVGFDPELDLLVNAADVCRRHPPVLALGDTLEVALKRMMTLGEEHLAVVEHEDTMKLAGCVHESEVLLEYNRQLLRARAEERGEGRDDVSPF
ncbi:chloride channel protein [Novispirillum sp. DQ9]|uniref:chloride channel protein n=1 Tax=Novispirillum sp. DQ9 TaxID=3398612 RepID=UPI003C7B1BA5